MALNPFCSVARKPRRNLICLGDQEFSNVQAILALNADVLIPDSFETKDAMVTWVRTQLFGCNGFIIQNIVGQKPRSTPNETGRPFGGATQAGVVSNTHTISGYDPSWKINVPWWNQLQEDATDLNLIFFTKDTWWPVMSELSARFGVVIPEDSKAQIELPFDFTWTQKGEVIPKDLPGIAQAVNKAVLMTVTAGTPTGFTSPSSGVYSTNTSTVSSLDFSVSDSGVGDLTWSIQESTIPGLSINPTTGTLSGTPTTVGTYLKTVQVENPCGVVGLFKIKVVVS